MSINRNAAAVYEAKLVVGVVDAIRCDVRGSGKQATKERCLCVDGWTERWDEGSLSARESMAMRCDVMGLGSIWQLSHTDDTMRPKHRRSRKSYPRVPVPRVQNRYPERYPYPVVRKQSATQIKPRPPEADAKKKKKVRDEVKVILAILIEIETCCTARKSRVVPAGFTADVQPQPRSSFPPKKKETRERRNIDKPQPQVGGSRHSDALQYPLVIIDLRESDSFGTCGIGRETCENPWGMAQHSILQRGRRGRGRYSSVRKPNKELYILYFRVDLEPDGLTSERYPPAVGRAKDQFPNTEIVD
ncbi:hypothetical protein H4582DRAFT_2060230 [Lactarius indigo]|nr:hypothetical protein H4582DRAFT_2060230 [Lactarius indigo]